MSVSKASGAEAHAIAQIKARAIELGVPPTSHDDLVEFVMGLTRNAWLRGKETGWKNAWNFKRRDTSADASPSSVAHSTRIAR